MVPRKASHGAFPFCLAGLWPPIRRHESRRAPLIRGKKAGFPSLSNCFLSLRRGYGSSNDPRFFSGPNGPRRALFPSYFRLLSLYPHGGSQIFAQGNCYSPPVSDLESSTPKSLHLLPLLSLPARFISIRFTILRCPRLRAQAVTVSSTPPFLTRLCLLPPKTVVDRSGQLIVGESNHSPPLRSPKTPRSIRPFFLLAYPPSPSQHGLFLFTEKRPPPAAESDPPS